MSSMIEVRKISTPPFSTPVEEAQPDTQSPQIKSENAQEFHVFKELERRWAKRRTELENKIQTLEHDQQKKTQTLEIENREKLELKQKEATLSREIDHLKAEIERQKKFIEELKIKNTDEEQIRKVHLSQYENRLQSYAQKVETERSEISQLARTLATEADKTRSLHPLRDHLKYTEFQLMRVEIALKKTPMVSPMRPKLEEHLQSLVEQRHFLTVIIQESEAELMEQTKKMLKIARHCDPEGNEESAELPPLPPRIALASKA